MRKGKEKIQFNSQIFSSNNNFINFQSKADVLQSIIVVKKEIGAEKNNSNKNDDSLLKKMSFAEKETYISENSKEINFNDISLNKMNKKVKEVSNVYDNGVSIKKLTFSNNMKQFWSLHGENSSNNHISDTLKNSKVAHIKAKITFDSLFNKEEIDSKNKKLTRNNPKRCKNFTEKLNNIIQNKSSLISNTHSLRNNFFESFTQNEIEMINQNKFKKINSLIKIDKKAFKNFLISKSFKHKKGETKSFLSDSEQEEQHLLKAFPLQKIESANTVDVDEREFKILDQNEIKNKIDFYSFFQRDSLQLESKSINKTLHKGYKANQNDLFDSNKSINDLGKFLYINTNKNN